MAKKLRSRLIRSPIPEGGAAAAAAAVSSSDAITTASIATTSGELARHSNSSSEDHHQQQPVTLDEGQQQRRRRSQRLLTNHGEQPPGAAAARTTSTTAFAEERTSFNSTTSEPGGASCKRKPDNRGIIRRAKTAMFRIATSPMTSSAIPLYPSPPRHSLIQLTSNANPRGEASNWSLHSQGTSNAITMTPITKKATKNVVEWMNDDAPSEIMLRILSFCGSRKLNALSRTSKMWNALVKDESVWRVLSEDTHKVSAPRKSLSLFLRSSFAHLASILSLLLDCINNLVV